jgi:hypothetical protein
MPELCEGLKKPEREVWFLKSHSEFCELCRTCYLLECRCAGCFKQFLTSYILSYTSVTKVMVSLRCSAKPYIFVRRRGSHIF